MGLSFRRAATAADVREEASRRILARYPLHKQLNIIREAGEGLAEMSAFIDATRQRCAELEVQAPIPATFRDDKHWHKRSRKRAK